MKVVLISKSKPCNRVRKMAGHVNGKMELDAIRDSRARARAAI